MLALATAHGSAYVAGQIVAIVGLVVRTLLYGRRALDRRGRRADAAVVRFLSPEPPAGEPSTSGSIAPPGFPEPARPLVSTASSAPTRRVGRSRRARTTDAIVAIVCALMLVAAIVRATGVAGNDPWDAPQARQLHAGFVAGCQQSSGGAIDCGCVFEHITSVTPFDTPEGFAILGQTIARTMPAAIQTGNANLLPTPVVDALRACVAS